MLQSKENALHRVEKGIQEIKGFLILHQECAREVDVQKRIRLYPRINERSWLYRKGSQNNEKVCRQVLQT